MDCFILYYGKLYSVFTFPNKETIRTVHLADQMTRRKPCSKYNTIPNYINLQSFIFSPQDSLLFLNYVPLKKSTKKPIREKVNVRECQITDPTGSVKLVL